MNTSPALSGIPFPTFPALPPASVLYVDSDRAMRRLHRQVLEGEGYSVRTAGDGFEGWEMVRHDHFDLVVTENTMPHLTGIELARRMRDGAIDSALIIAADQVGPLMQADLSFLRPAAILYKPYLLVDLLSAVRRALGGQPGNGAIDSALIRKRIPDRWSARVAHWGINE